MLGGSALRRAQDAPIVSLSFDRLNDPEALDGSNGRSGVSVKILVVDDSAMMRKLIARALGRVEGEEVEIVEATDGMEALAMVQHHGNSIDIILCDMNMPNWNGLTLLRSLRGSQELKHIPFVIVTADESDVSIEQALREGAAGVVGKPFQPEVIVDLVRKRRSHGDRVTSSAFKTDTITRMVRSMSRSALRREQGSR